MGLFFHLYLMYEFFILMYVFDYGLANSAALPAGFSLQKPHPLPAVLTESSQQWMLLAAYSGNAMLHGTFNRQALILF